MKTNKPITLLILTLAFLSQTLKAQGTWTALNTMAPDSNSGVMLLLSDGTVMAKSVSCSNCDTIGNIWNKLTPDSTGSYINGNWSRFAPMHDTRLYFASQVLKDGRVFVAGGEYGSGKYTAEMYNPLTDTWTMTPNLNKLFADANSEILEDGRMLVATLDGNGNNTSIFNPKTNTWSTGPTCHGNHDESAWVKLPDNSILFVDIASTNSERYIPALNQWVIDGHVPVTLYDQYWYEAGAGFLLPDGRAFFLGATGHTAYYTPTGTTSQGTWAAGPDFPIVNGKQYGTTDAPGAMMVNGKILCAASPINTAADLIHSFYAPTRFFEFDYLSNTFTQVSAPGGADSLNIACYATIMLDLPNGDVLYADTTSAQYYVYTPNGSALAAGKPTINNITQLDCDTFKVTGTLFNGISEGAAYGDDWQMATNYPLVRLSNGNKTYYARTYNWNSTGVQRGNKADTTFFSIPNTLPYATYSLVVVANGIASNPVSFVNSTCFVGIHQNKNVNTINLSAYPNPAEDMLSVSFTASTGGTYSISLLDMFGRTIIQQTEDAVVGNNINTLSLNAIAKGVYTLVYQKDSEVLISKIIIK
ncbi:MAG: T9SS type A sorting domain-containing protein [Bacteroidia bacterium]